MQKISYFGILTVLCSCIIPAAYAEYDIKLFQAEIIEGIDKVGAGKTLDTSDKPRGELGDEVYENLPAVGADGMKLFIPTSMYVRMGAGLNLGFGTSQAELNNVKYNASGGYAVQIGLGWNLASYARAELDFQEMTLKFSSLDNMHAEYHTLGAMMYFDFAKRYVQTGDITRRRTFVPFMGIGAGFGMYEFEGAGGADGFVGAIPRAALGFNVALTDLIGIDVMYQYQMMLGNGFGWNGQSDDANSISNIMVSFRANF